MKKINSGKLRAIGYDVRARLLQVKLDNGSTLQYSGVSEGIWQYLSSYGAALQSFSNFAREGNSFQVHSMATTDIPGKLQPRQILTHFAAFFRQLPHNS